MNSRFKNWLLIGVIIMLVLYHFQSCNRNNEKLKDKDSLIAALNDTLRTTRDSDSTTRSTIRVIQTERAKDFLKLQLKDRELMELQELVKEYKKVLVAGSSVTKGLIETVAELKKATPPVIIRRDTVQGEDSMIYVYPVYQDSLTNKWVKIIGTMGKDSSDFKLWVENEFTAIMGYDKKKKAPFIEYHLLNPYSTMKTLRSYQVSPLPVKKWVVAVGGGYGLNANFDNPLDLKNWKNNTIIGVFIGKSLIRF